MFIGCYDKTFEEGTYVCIVCEQPLFSSKTKFDSGCGWPAFNDVLDKGKVKLTPDTSGGMKFYLILYNILWILFKAKFVIFLQSPQSQIWNKIILNHLGFLIIDWKYF